MVAIFGLHVLHRSTPRYGRVGMIGTVLAIVGYGIVALVIAAGIATGGPTLAEVRIAGAITVLIGSALLGVGDFAGPAGALVVRRVVDHRLPAGRRRRRDLQRRRGTAPRTALGLRRPRPAEEGRLASPNRSFRSLRQRAEPRIRDYDAFRHSSDPRPQILLAVISLLAASLMLTTVSGAAADSPAPESPSSAGPRANPRVDCFTPGQAAPSGRSGR